MSVYDSLRISGAFVDYSKARVSIIAAPYEGSVSWGRGASKGPEAIVDAFLNMELYDDELDTKPSNVGLCLLDLDLKDKSPEDAVLEVENKVAEVVGDGKYPVILGGEHSLSIGAVRGLKKTCKDLSVLQLDAHADLRDELNNSKYGHACVMARIREKADAVQVGVRSLSGEEAETINEKNYHVSWARDIFDNNTWFDKAINCLSDNVYLTIDLDVFDPSIMPSTGTPEPGGLDWYQVTAFLREVSRRKRIVGFDIVELSPKKGFNAPNFLAAKLMYKLIGYVFSDVK